MYEIIKYKTIIFDLDGTLLDTLDDLTNSTNAALSAFGFPLRTKEEVRSFVGNGIRKLIERALGENIAQADEVLSYFKAYYADHCADCTKPYEGTMSLLTELKRRGIKTAVLSNKADFAVKKLAKEYFNGLLLAAVGENEAEGIRKKPAPDSLFAVMKELGAEKGSTLYVGDSEVDIETAANAGVDCMCVTWGFRDKEFLRSQGGKLFADSPMELLHFLQKEQGMSLMKVGNTPLVRIKIDGVELFAKQEGENPAGSIKDRVAFAIIEDAEKRGLLKAGGTVVEATSGNTGIGLAYAASQKGYQALIVMPDSMSVERRALIEKHGGMVLLTDGKLGMQGAVDRAKAIVASTENCVFADQFCNPVCQKAHYQTTGPEIWEQTQGQVDIFVACVGTGGTLTGVGRYLKEQNPNVRVIAVEPAASPLLSQGWSGPHAIQGIGANFIPSVLDRSVYDEVVTVTNEESIEMAKRLFMEHELPVGISSGAAVAAAIKIGKRCENKDKKIVTILPDDRGRYRSILLGPVE